MSARSYKVCPRCEDNKRIELEEEEQKLKARYGGISELAYRKRFLRLEARKNELLDATLAEYYDHDFVQENGERVFKVRYSASCDVCGFSFSHRNWVPFNLRDKKIEPPTVGICFVTREPDEINETETSQENLEEH